MKRTHKLVIAMVTGLGLGLATVASADPGFGPGSGPGCQGYGGGPGMGPGSGPGMGPGMGRGAGHGMGMGMGRGAGFGNPVAMAEGHLAWLKAELKITPAQEAAWNAFADQRRQQAEAMKTRMSSLQDKAPAMATAVERMEARSQWAKQRQEQRDKSIASFKTLYAALSTEQKAMLDQGLEDGGYGFHGGPGRRMR